MIQNFNQIPVVFRNYLQDYITILKENFKEHLLSVILFGSVARGQWKRESDIDLLVIFTNELMDTAELNQKLTRITIKFESEMILLDANSNALFCPIKEIAFTLKELERFRTFFYDVSIDGILMYDCYNIGKKFKERIQHRIIEKGLKRINTGNNGFYWKRKDIKFGEIIEL